MGSKKGSTYSLSEKNMVDDYLGCKFLQVDLVKRIQLSVLKCYNIYYEAKIKSSVCVK